MPDCLALRLARPGTVLLDSARPDADSGHGGALLFEAPVRIIAAETLADVRPALAAADAALAEGFHVAGMLAYEAGAAVVDGLAPTEADPSVPLVWFGVYRAPERLGALGTDFNALADGASIRDLTFALSREEYRDRIDRARAHIRDGDVYQVNLTAPLTFRTDAAPAALYAALRAGQPVPYGGFLNLGETTLLSVSPELFVRVDTGPDGRTITARPMKGTTPRGATPAADDRLAAELVARAKDRAENLMIVDLLRNDVSRVAEAGSVRVPALFAAERYATLTQMTSTVTARLRPDVGLSDVLTATFPCGSVTGAPKRRAVEILRMLEDGPRGAYCGAIGYAAPCQAGGLGTAAFSVAIRTATLTPDAGGGFRGRYSVGSGVVWDSQADDEFDECLLKARVLKRLAGAPIRVPEDP
ncbi:MAG TPA: aminodeoxychorismate synthase component I [Rubricoccaceae bacterium]